MAKHNETVPTPLTQPAPQADVNPELAFRAAWNANKDNMRAVLTKTHEIRGNLKPSEKARAQTILESYGL